VEPTIDGLGAEVGFELPAPIPGLELELPADRAEVGFELPAPIPGLELELPPDRVEVWPPDVGEAGGIVLRILSCMILRSENDIHTLATMMRCEQEKIRNY
jgi:hypothetical protein